MNGFDNEKEIIKELSTKSFQQLNSNMQRVILKLNCNNIPDSISAVKYGGADKADICIRIDEDDYFVSVKKGTGNSVHQEPVEDFILFLSDNFDADNSVFDDIRYFIWGDGTLDGSGLKENRVSSTQLKKENPEKIANIQEYFNKYKKELLRRFLITGVKSTHAADYLLYGNINNCHIVESDKVLNFALGVEKSSLSIGVLTFQAWNRNLSPKGKSEGKRGSIQLKWGTLKDDIICL